MAVTARDLIQGAMRLIGVLSIGESPAAPDEQDALLTLNQMLDSWSTESLMINAIVREVFPFIPGQTTYTMGTGGNFNTTRPLKITNVLYQQLGTTPGFEQPISIINRDMYADISVKTVTSSLPTKVYVEGSFPLETLNFWPVPSVANNVVLYSWKPLVQFATVNDSVSLPPGYLKAIRYGLALELSPEYGIQPSTAVLAGASEGRANIKRMNTKEILMSCDNGILGNAKPFNWINGE